MFHKSPAAGIEPASPPSEGGVLLHFTFELLCQLHHHGKLDNNL